MKTLTTIPRKQPQLKGTVSYGNLPSKPKRGIGYLWLLSIIVLLAIGWFGLMKIIDFNTKYEIKKQRVISMVWHWPLKVEERQAVIVKETLPSYPGEIDTPIKKYICDKFGVYDCKIALGIVQAESNFNETAWNINSNGTIDVGLWQINSVHFNQPGCDIKADLDPIRATDCAKKIFDTSGWKAWTTYANNSYLSYAN